ncbi:restriction endonuclease subunit S [Corynebacterium glutamicum]|uniref:restriction endonuclease subunit S n=1 Tax=Corynebacterium glutamicum TaxID=1718 RepID=UPI001C6F1BF0|nr:restriction endonuclease subunit S [Corynebacterium glutamicum]
MSSTNKWPTVKLGEVAEILMGQAPPSSATNKDRLGYPLIAGAGDFSSTGIEPIKFTNVDARLSEADDIIISIRATIGPFEPGGRRGIHVGDPEIGADPVGQGLFHRELVHVNQGNGTCTVLGQNGRIGNLINYHIL